MKAGSTIETDARAAAGVDVSHKWIVSEPDCLVP